ncbi:hypothetical protein MHLP_00835 [Candidatus Mycoplasma haematolamae str. Purdue]|uniref:Uncharacterized protein n=1 Tax=Mycoplasma haematolamae (strain Purdue) TaxID=1212765 RepID=I7C5G3_MYCHA|nr:hypothetical protein [Candidatus Mycoplasma haematolamae]AFO51747.1 hypothetical protein MHLP_00835 [Candidatus Mycoplasma haematolamae str. Purdue]
MVLKAIALKLGLPALLVGGGTYGVVQAIPLESFDTSGSLFSISTKENQHVTLMCPYYDYSNNEHANLKLVKVSEDTAELKCVKANQEQKEKTLKVTGTEKPEVGLSKLVCESQDLHEIRAYACSLDQKKLQLTLGKETIGDKLQQKVTIKVT